MVKNKYLLIILIYRMFIYIINILVLFIRVFDLFFHGFLANLDLVLTKTSYKFLVVTISLPKSYNFFS